MSARRVSYAGGIHCTRRALLTLRRKTGVEGLREAVRQGVRDPLALDRHRGRFATEWGVSEERARSFTGPRVNWSGPIRR